MPRCATVTSHQQPVCFHQCTHQVFLHNPPNTQQICVAKCSLAGSTVQRLHHATVWRVPACYSNIRQPCTHMITIHKDKQETPPHTLLVLPAGRNITIVSDLIHCTHGNVQQVCTDSACVGIRAAARGQPRNIKQLQLLWSNCAVKQQPTIRQVNTHHSVQRQQKFSLNCVICSGNVPKVHAQGCVCIPLRREGPRIHGNCFMGEIKCISCYPFDHSPLPSNFRIGKHFRTSTQL